MKKTYILENIDPTDSSRATSSITQQSSRRSLRETSISSTTSGTRRILVRRKALQDFYKLPARPLVVQDAPSENDEQLDPEVSRGFFGTGDEFAEFAAKNPVGEILRYRNAASRRLDAHDLAKKGMIYDNYYQLIQLSHTLDTISSSHRAHRPHHQSTLGTKPSLDSIDSVVENLKSFIEPLAPSFDKPFADLIADFSSSQQPVTITGPPAQVIPEISSLLNPDTVDPKDRSGIATDVSRMIGSQGVLLDSQLHEIRNKLNS